MQIAEARALQGRKWSRASKRGVRRLEWAGAQEKHGCRKLSAEAENAQPPGSCRVP